MKIVTSQNKFNISAKKAADAQSSFGFVSINSTRDNFSVFITIAVICLITTAAYCPILFNFFSGDDFVHLTWLRQAMSNPELILRNFHSSWLDGTTTRFYRPLISLFMVSDYRIWGINGFGFHLTNLLFQLVSTVLVFLVSRKLIEKFHNSEAFLVPVFASLFFGVYPLHPEAVSWITGRVDVIVTAFYLLSFWSYLRWRQSHHFIDLLATAFSMILALLSKEMAIIMPAMFVAYELLLNARRQPGSSTNLGCSVEQTFDAEEPMNDSSKLCSTNKRRQKFGSLHFRDGQFLQAVSFITGLAEWLKVSIAPTLVFWLVLAVYFVVRRWALGTFVGGYDDSLFFISNWHTFLTGWLHGLQMLVVPINRDFLGMHSMITRSWEVSIALMCGIVLIKAVTSRTTFQLALFYAVWFMLCLAPVYKLFNIADDLQGSRLAFMATVPLCMFLSLAFARNRKAELAVAMPRRLFQSFQALLAAAVLALATYLLMLNNQAWRQAGHESNAIRAALHNVYGPIKGDPQLLFLGLPDNRHGAYVCRNALDGMMRKPQFVRDVKQATMLDRYELTFPFGYLKKSIVSSKNELLAFRWERSKARFVPLDLFRSNTKRMPPLTHEWNSRDLKQVLRPSLAEGIAHWLSDGTLEVKSKPGSKIRPKVDIDLGRFNCLDVDFIAVTVRSLSRQTGGFDLFYKNDFAPDFDLYHRNHCEVSSPGEDETLVFSLHNLPEWVFGGICTGLQLKLPETCHVLVQSIAFLPADAVAPALTFPHSDFAGSKGFLHLSSSQPTQMVAIDAHNMAQAAGIVLEITRTNLVFTTQSTRDLSTVTMSEVKELATRTSIRLDRKMFPATGQYELRAWAIDSKGRRLGVAGDHIVICIDS